MLDLGPSTSGHYCSHQINIVYETNNNLYINFQTLIIRVAETKIALMRSAYYKDLIHHRLLYFSFRMTQFFHWVTLLGFTVYMSETYIYTAYFSIYFGIDGKNMYVDCMFEHLFWNTCQKHISRLHIWASILG